MQLYRWLQIAIVCLGHPCSQSLQTIGVTNWGSSSCVLDFECWTGRQYVLQKEINCWGAFPKCFLLCTYLSKYLFQLLLTCQCIFFSSCLHLCVCVPGSLFQQQYKRRMKNTTWPFDSHNSQFYRPTSKYIPVACLLVCWVLSAFDRHLSTIC